MVGIFSKFCFHWVAIKLFYSIAFFEILWWNLIIFHGSLFNWFLITKVLVITLMYSSRLHAWWSTQSRLATLLSSLIARRQVGPQSDLLALLCVMFSCVFVTFPHGVLGQVWYLIVLISDLYLLSFFKNFHLYMGRPISPQTSLKINE